MCASYGLGGGPYGREIPMDLPPLDEREVGEDLARWAADQRNTARITGKNARNFNPLIRDTGSGRELHYGWWWLWVGGAPAKFSAFNSRDDALTRRWRGAFQTRALLPATWYIEKKQHFALDGELFAIAAITATAEEADGNPITSYSMVTRHGVGDAEHVLSDRGEARMPLILPREFHDVWLDPERAGDATLVADAVAASEEICRAAQNLGPVPEKS